MMNKFLTLMFLIVILALSAQAQTTEVTYRNSTPPIVNYRVPLGMNSLALSVAVIYDPTTAKYYYLDPTGDEVVYRRKPVVGYNVPRDLAGNPLSVLVTYDPATGKFYYATGLGSGGSGGGLYGSGLTANFIPYVFNDSTLKNTPWEFSGGNLDMNGSRISDLGEPSSSKDATPKSYVDTLRLSSLDDTQTDIGNHIANTSDPHDIRLNQIGNPTASGTISMAAFTQTFNFTNPAGGMDFNWLGGASGHLFEISQNTGNPGAGTHLLHIDADDPDVVGIHVSHASSTSYSILGTGGKVLFTPTEGATISGADSAGLNVGTPTDKAGVKIYGGLYTIGQITSKQNFHIEGYVDLHDFIDSVRANEFGGAGGGVDFDSLAFRMFGTDIQPQYGSNLDMLSGSLTVGNNVSALDSILAGIIVYDSLRWMAADSSNWRVKEINIPHFNPFSPLPRKGYVIIDVEGFTPEFYTAFTDSSNGVSILSIETLTHGFTASGIGSNLDGGRIVVDLAWQGYAFNNGTPSIVGIGGYLYGNRRAYTLACSVTEQPHGDSWYRAPIATLNAETPSSVYEFTATLKINVTISAGNNSSYYVGLINN